MLSSFARRTGVHFTAKNIAYFIHFLLQFEPKNGARTGAFGFYLLVGGKSFRGVYQAL